MEAQHAAALGDQSYECSGGRYHDVGSVRGATVSWRGAGASLHADMHTSFLSVLLGRVCGRPGCRPAKVESLAAKALTKFCLILI